MKKSFLYLLLIILVSACTSTKNLSYLSNLPENTEGMVFGYKMPVYKIQERDILYIDVKTMTVDGKIENVLQGSSSLSQNYVQGETNQYLLGYSVDHHGNIVLPIIGKIGVGNKSIPDARVTIQHKIDSVYTHAYVDVKLLSFKFTVLGEARVPGTYQNYNDYLTIFEAIGRAGGVGDFGRRDNILVVRNIEKGTRTFRINLNNKDILSSEAYFLMPNDVIIIQPVKHKTFNLNLPTISFTTTTVASLITTTLLLINFFK